MRLKAFTLSSAIALGLASFPAVAQDAGVTVGAKVYGAQGAEIGTVEKVEGDNIMVSAGGTTTTLPASALSKAENGFSIAWTKAQFDAAVAEANQQAAAQLDAALVPGTTLYSVDGVELGTITSVEGDGTMIVELDSGEFSATKDQVALNEGRLTFLASAADVRAAVAAASGG